MAKATTPLILVLATLVSVHQLNGASLQGGGSKLKLDPCKLLQCPAERQCQADETRVIPEGECCPVCQPCSTIECPNPPLCRFIGESLQVPKGECCPQCLPDPCAGILCVAPVCIPGSGEVPFLREGECCAQCVPLEQACATVECEPGQECRFILGQPRCIPELVDNSPCALIDCFGVCRVINGRAVCLAANEPPILTGQ